MLSISAIPAFNDNYIWCLFDSDSRKALVVDPGDARPVIAYLDEHGLTLDTILVTHHHPDHVGGIAELVRALGPDRIVAPSDSPFKAASETVSSGDRLIWRNVTFEVMAVPGHTLDHVAYFCPSPVDGCPALFCGDTLFVCGCGRLFEGTPAQMRASLEQFLQLDDDTRVYCAHEYTLSNLKFARNLLPADQALADFERECEALRQDGTPTVPALLGREKQLNPFLRWDDPAVIAAATRYAQSHNLSCDGPDQVFAAVRHGKDHF
ncbi:hydroxyacylglutathione hydrolase [Marinobacter zhejiangensis]|uniref:Hydroxyacylglutathione hydrolase n=1 Tax=Marinobacter zhejiangensis TaxID=488535 RepID=A0A1I4RUM8_9GAMM|nr:hydroxyacylglutathione hydrolase [Marinobacter zhejiangensis]SFM55942.1 hydroxyacylglutathione hydrolase [Marinobacter zhejiangensis]